ncbi:MAG TPA: hypothetical protein VMH83_10910, partial [Candidatus Acidoferrum sp.]|nr:hypothetical protein [Candidatus Acidoferrum sp.]
ESFEVVEFATPPKSADDLQATLIRQFRLGADLSFRKSLIRHLSTKPRDLQKLIMLIDDGDTMSVDALVGIHGLRDLEHNGQALISVLLCGDKGLNAILAKEELALLQADITLNYSLNPLGDNDIGDFCSAYMQQTGKPRAALSQRYLDSLLQQTQGLPGKVIEELAKALQQPDFLLLNGREEAPVETKAPIIGQVIQGIADKVNSIPPETKRWLKPTAGVLFTAAALSTVYVYYPKALSVYGDFTKGPSAPEPAAVANNSPPATPAQPAATAPTPAPVAQPQPARQPQPAVAAAPAPAAPPIPASPPPSAVATATPAPVPATAPAPKPAASASTSKAPAPAPMVVSTAQPAPASKNDLQQIINDWVAAWQRQDLNAYLSFYHTDFAPLYQDSRSSWRADRTRSLARPSRIAINITDFTVEGSDATGTTVSFWLDYQSPSYADRTQKELVLGQDTDGKLRILRELNREVQPLAAGPLPPASTVAGNSQGTAKPAASVATATRIGEPLMIQPNAAVALPANGHDNLNQFVSSWLNAWQHKDLADYFGHYSPGFKSSLTTSTEAWRDDRAVKITRPAVIQLQLDNLELVKETGGETVLKLTVTYHSSYYADRTQKELHLQLSQNGGLQIVEEKNLSVEALPLSRLLPSVQVAMQELARSLAANQL